MPPVMKLPLFPLLLFCVIAVRSRAEVNYLIEPAACLQEREEVDTSVVSAAQERLKLCEQQLQAGLSSCTEILESRSELLELQREMPGVTEAERRRLSELLLRNYAEWDALVNARRKENLISASDFYGRQLREYFRRARYASAVEQHRYLEMALNAARMLEEETRKGYLSGLATVFDCLLSAIAHEEMKMWLAEDADTRRTLADGLLKRYNELADMYALRVEKTGAAVEDSREARLAAYTFAGDCARYLYHDTAAMQRWNAAILDEFQRLHDDYYFAYQRGEVTAADYERLVKRMSDECLRQKMAEYPEKSPLIKRILSLPDNSFYEEKRESLIERLYAGEYNKEVAPDGTIEYLSISGDGCAGQRVFILNPQDELYLLTEEWEEEPETDSLSRFDSTHGEWTDHRSDIPKSFLESEDLTELWPRIQRWMNEHK